MSGSRSDGTALEDGRRAQSRTPPWTSESVPGRDRFRAGPDGARVHTPRNPAGRGIRPPLPVGRSRDPTATSVPRATYPAIHRAMVHLDPIAPLPYLLNAGTELAQPFATPRGGKRPQNEGSGTNLQRVNGNSPARNELRPVRRARRDNQWRILIKRPDLETRRRLEPIGSNLELWRRVRDSNPRWRFCRPLPYHLANSPPEPIA